MTPQEFRRAYLEAQNGLGNNLQTLINLSRDLNELVIRYRDLASSIQTDYQRMNEVVEQFLNEQESQD